MSRARLLKPSPVMTAMCSTCPFRPGSPHAYLQDDLARSAATEASRICHSTGSNNAINRHTAKKPKLCRGARDIQLKIFYAMKVISAPTDKAWAEKVEEINHGRR